MGRAERRIARAIARRKQIQARQRRRVYYAGGAALTIALSAVFSFASFNGADLAAATVAKAQSFLDLMHRRSPGQRTEAHLTKLPRKHYRVLAERAPPVPAIIVPAYNPEVGMYAPPLFVPAAAHQLPVLAMAPPPPPVYQTPPGVGIFTHPKPPQAPPAGPVPEPDTWAMLIVGFGAIGYMLRRTREAKRIAIG